DEIKAVIKQHQLQDQVFLLGGVEHKQVLQLLRATDFFIRVPTKEGFGISILEALAAGTPVITSRVGGLADFVSDSNAWIPSSTAAAEIADTIAKLTAASAQQKQRK